MFTFYVREYGFVILQCGVGNITTLDNYFADAVLAGRPVKPRQWIEWIPKMQYQVKSFWFGCSKLIEVANYGATVFCDRW